MGGTMAGPTKFCEIFYDSVHLPLADSVVGGINNGWKTAMATARYGAG